MTAPEEPTIEKSVTILIQDVLVQAERVTADAPWGDDGTCVDTIEVLLGDATGGEALAPVPSGGTCLDLVVCNPSPSLPRGIALGEAVQAPESLATVDPGITVLGLSGFPGTPSPPVSWMQVEGSAEQACSGVAAIDKVLWEVMVMVGLDILQPIWVS
jgi:hypothetical protein